MTTPKTNVEQIKADVERDVEKGLITAEAGAEVVATAEEAAAREAATPEEAPEIAPEAVVSPPDDAPPVEEEEVAAPPPVEDEAPTAEPVVVDQAAETARLQQEAGVDVQVDPFGIVVNVKEAAAIETRTTDPNRAANITARELRDRGVSEDRIREIIKTIVTPETRAQIEAQEAEAITTASTINQVSAALASGVAVAPDILRGLNVPEEQVARIERQQAALRAIEAVRDVKTAAGYNLTRFFEQGGALSTAANAGFSPSDVDTALAGVRGEAKVIEQVRIGPSVGLESLATDDFAAPTPSETPEEREFNRARIALREFIETDVPGPIDAPDQIRLDDAIDKGVAVSDLRALGVPEGAISAAFRRQQERDLFALERRARQTGATIPVVPRPVARPAPLPGEKFALPEDLQIEARDAIRRTALQGALAGVQVSPVAERAASQSGAILDITGAVERGDIGAEEARVIISGIKGQNPAGEFEDIGYLVPGLGTFMLYKTVQRSPTPTNLAFFSTSAFLDVVLFVVPVARAAGGAVTRGGAVTPGGPVTRRVIAIPKSKVVRTSLTDQRGDLSFAPPVRPVTEARLANIIRNATEAPAKPRTRPPAPVREPIRKPTPPDRGPGVPPERPPVRRGDPAPLPERRTVPDRPRPEPVKPEPAPPPKEPTKTPPLPIKKPTEPPLPEPKIAPSKPPAKPFAPGTKPLSEPLTKPLIKPLTEPGPKPVTKPAPTPQPRTAPRFVPGPQRLVPAVAPQVLPRVLPLTEVETEVQPLTLPETQPLPQELPLPRELPLPQEFVQPAEQQQVAPFSVTQPLTEQELQAAFEEAQPRSRPDADVATLQQPTPVPVTLPVTDDTLQPTPIRPPLEAPEFLPGPDTVFDPLDDIVEPPPIKRPPPSEPTPVRRIPPTRVPPTTRVPPPGKPPPGKPPPKDTPPVKPRIPRPSITMEDGRPLPRGVFAEEVRWGQGENRAILNLRTGSIRWLDRDPDGRSPQQTFVAIKLTRSRPPARKFKMGFEDVTVTGSTIAFDQNELADGSKKTSPIKRRKIKR